MWSRLENFCILTLNRVYIQAHPQIFHMKGWMLNSLPTNGNSLKTCVKWEKIFKSSILDSMEFLRWKESQPPMGAPLTKSVSVFLFHKSFSSQTERFHRIQVDYKWCVLRVHNSGRKKTSWNAPDTWMCCGCRASCITLFLRLSLPTTYSGCNFEFASGAVFVLFGWKFTKTISNSQIAKLSRVAVAPWSTFFHFSP